jgi:rRNA maturation RNase YbeY
MISYHYETTFKLENETELENWIHDVVSQTDFTLGEINYIFCDDDYLHKLNVEFLQHDTLTDIISFDTTIGKLLNGDIFISIERVHDNANEFNVAFNEELHRVMIHGVLHYMGYKDKTKAEKATMRNAENNALSDLSY